MSGKAGGKVLERPESERIFHVLMDPIRDLLIHVDIAGSYRRGRPTSNDLDIAVEVKPECVEQFDEWLVKMGGRAKNKKPSRRWFYDEAQVDIYISNPGAYGAMLAHCTGSKEENIRNRAVAIRRGMALNQYGLFKRDTDIVLACLTEEAIYEALGVPFRRPDQRV